MPGPEEGPPANDAREDEVGNPPSDAREALAEPRSNSSRPGGVPGGTGVPAYGGEGERSPPFSNPPHESPPQLACRLHARVPMPLIDLRPMLSTAPPPPPAPLKARLIWLGSVAKPPLMGLFGRPYTLVSGSGGSSSAYELRQLLCRQRYNLQPSQTATNAPQMPVRTAAAVGNMSPPLLDDGEAGVVGLPSRPMEGTTWVAGAMLGAGVPESVVPARAVRGQRRCPS